MIGGMISSTLLTLIVIPAIYALVKGFGLKDMNDTAGPRPSIASPVAPRKVPELAE
jgi:copper/silver efflux system protein